jgi:lipopolysaccharide assembly outer membrane protein LptD (OstA)
VFDFLGVPVIWVPYFQMADPTVKRKSGFLMPSYSHSNELGNTVQIPYYFALSDHYDFTFAPMITEKAGTLLLGDWRQRMASGGYRVELAGVWDEGTFESPTDGDFRGSIKTQGKFALNPYYSWGWDVLAETDETFRRYYNLDSRLKTDRVCLADLSRGTARPELFLDQVLQHPESAVQRRALLGRHGLPDHRLRLHRQQADHRRRAELHLQRNGVPQSGGR